MAATEAVMMAIVVVVMGSSHHSSWNPSAGGNIASQPCHIGSISRSLLTLTFIAHGSVSRPTACSPTPDTHMPSPSVSYEANTVYTVRAVHIESVCKA